MGLRNFYSISSATIMDKFKNNVWWVNMFLMLALCLYEELGGTRAEHWEVKWKKYKKNGALPPAKVRLWCSWFSLAEYYNIQVACNQGCSCEMFDKRHGWCIEGLFALQIYFMLFQSFWKSPPLSTTSFRKK